MTGDDLEEEVEDVVPVTERENERQGTPKPEVEEPSEKTDELLKAEPSDIDEVIATDIIDTQVINLRS